MNWVQNSVFEGEISEGNIKKLKMELNSIIKNNEDSVIIYNFQIQDILIEKLWALRKMDLIL